MKNAFVLRSRGINHGHAHHAYGTIIRDMSDGQFADWEAAGMVREATEEEADGVHSFVRKTDEASPPSARTQLTPDEIAVQEASRPAEEPAPAKSAASKKAPSKRA